MTEAIRWNRATTFDRYGTPLAELEGDLTEVVWRLNRPGRARFAVARSDAKATQDYLRLHNRMLFRFDNGLPDWAGPIVLPRQWDYDAITLTLNTGEALLDVRMTDSSRYFESAAPGTIFQALIEEANAVLDMGVEIGTVWTGGVGRTPAPYHYDRLLPKIQKLAELTGNDFVLTPTVTQGQLRFKAHWYERRGSDKPTVALIEGHNVIVKRFQEVGPMVNHWGGIGEGSSWSEKPKGEVSDLGSQSDYGLFEDSVVFTGVTSQATLDANLAELLETTARPRTTVQLAALNKAPAEFADYDVGDRVWVSLHSFGFSGSGFGYEHAVRILARSYDPQTGQCDLVVEEDDFS